jgi:hypothetical protein
MANVILKGSWPTDSFYRTVEIDGKQVRVQFRKDVPTIVPDAAWRQMAERNQTSLIEVPTGDLKRFQAKPVPAAANEPAGDAAEDQAAPKQPAKRQPKRSAAK